MAASIRDAAGLPIAGISVAGPAARMTRGGIWRLGQLVREMVAPREYFAAKYGRD